MTCVQIATSSRSGATREIAESIGAELEAGGLSVALADAESVTTLGDFRAWPAIRARAGDISATLAAPR